MLSLSNKSRFSLSFDMITQSCVKFQENINQKQDDIDIFINDYIKQNIEQSDYVKKWVFTETYIKSLSIVTINRIIQEHSNENDINDLIEYYLKIFKQMEVVLEEHISLIEKENNENIKRNMAAIVLLNSITYSNFLF